MADWIIRRGIPLALVTSGVAAIVVSRGDPSEFFTEMMAGLRSTIVEFVPRIL
jgi:hypothetical protein